ncbi:MAG: hypothetical protein ABW252_12945 [Polyangiales bacterium]
MSRCPRCDRPPNGAAPKLDLGGLSVCSHCGAFLEPSEGGVGFRLLLPRDLEAVDEDLRWQLLRARAEVKARIEQARLG